MENPIKITVLVVSGVTLVLLTAMVTFVITRPMPCRSDRLSFPKKDQWDAHDMKEFPAFGVKIMRTVVGERCYLLPKMAASVQDGEGQMMKVIPDALSPDMLRHLAGDEASEYCRGYSAYAVTPIQRERKVRQANDTAAAAAAPAANADHGPDNYINALPNECEHNVIIQCPDTVQESCTSGVGYPGFGGVYRVTTKCLKPTEFNTKIVTRCKENDDTKADRTIKCMSKIQHKAEVALLNLKQEREKSG